MSATSLPAVSRSVVSLPFELFVGWRYTRAKRRNHFVSFISLLAMLGIALGVAALIVVLSVMNGFQRELRTRILGVAAHVEIEQFEGQGRRLSEPPDDDRLVRFGMHDSAGFALAPHVVPRPA